MKTIIFTLYCTMACLLTAISQSSDLSCLQLSLDRIQKTTDSVVIYTSIHNYSDYNFKLVYDSFDDQGSAPSRYKFDLQEFVGDTLLSHLGLLPNNDLFQPVIQVKGHSSHSIQFTLTKGEEFYDKVSAGAEFKLVLLWYAQYEVEFGMEVGEDIKDKCTAWSLRGEITSNTLIYK